MPERIDEIQSLRSEIEQKNAEVLRLNKELVGAMSRRLSGDKGTDLSTTQSSLQSSNEELSRMCMQLIEKLSAAVDADDLSKEEIAKFENILVVSQSLSCGTYTGTAPSSHLRSD